MRRAIGSLLVVMTLVGSTGAANLRIVGYDAMWSSASDPSPVYYVLILNEQGVTDRLVGWQLCLVILPTTGTTGVLKFASADLPREPYDDYLLAGDSATLAGAPPEPLIVGPTDTFLLGDYTISNYGSEVPPMEKSLLKVDFFASEDAYGVFNIAVVPGPTNSEWISLDTTNFSEMERGFENVPLEGDPVVIGRVAVNVPIPEPCGVLLLSLLGGAMLLLPRQRARRRGSRS